MFFLQSLKNDDFLQKNAMCHPMTFSEKSILEWIERYEKSKDSFLMLICKKPGLNIGYIVVNRYSSLNKTAYFGIVIDKSYHNKGYGYNALSMFFNHINSTIGVRKILLEVLCFNVSAIYLYQKLGFRTVGILKEHFYTNNIFYDAYLMEKILTF